MKVLANRFKGTGINQSVLNNDPGVSTDAEKVRSLLKDCPKADETPLVESNDLANLCNVANIYLKDERDRMGLGSFKALGAAYVIASDAMKANPSGPDKALNGTTYVTASAGNHGLSVAAGAHIFGATAVIYLAETVPEAFAQRLKEKGAQVVRAGDNYEASMEAASQAASDNGWILLSDSSWPGYLDLPRRVMEGYLAMAAEAAEQMAEPPTHIFLQAGVGGLAAAVTAYARKVWGNAPVIVVVEPEAAPALMESIKAGKSVVTEGPVSSMGRLDCKEPSILALEELSRNADYFVTISEEEAAAVLPELSKSGLETTPSGGAGVAALFVSGDNRDELRLTNTSRILVFLSEQG